ncbi:Uncharacterised protein [Mycobacterium tuberculosis]|uniref:Uncharacterized protein n=1 Tax=Mycobacterium tuberculosis TaxID=1773 RepID=A0A655FDJ8_MYCTX|nr:Uncharacterised protein [Mycobacterium tuberculosis]CKP76201.1 Uncharacterised protein [Mycobacterium tuberculosis]CKT47250.1 Uncharacterised protein [Mycobacterium tuberculosis]CNV62428.1 Uncharacterised protein [Mycobacterium tuberculosis]COW99179.1 Uncharacterised protein [Mycobacterium tuberculosis]
MAADGGAVEDQFDDAAVFGVDVAGQFVVFELHLCGQAGQGGVDEFGGRAKRQGEQFVQFLGVGGESERDFGPSLPGDVLSDAVDVQR